MKDELKIKNYIEIDGDEIPIDSLSKEKAAQIGLLLQDVFMESMGYRRKKDTC